MSSRQGPTDSNCFSLRHCANCFKKACTWLLILYFLWCMLASVPLVGSKTPSLWGSTMYLHTQHSMDNKRNVGQQGIPVHEECMWNHCNHTKSSICLGKFLSGESTSHQLVEFISLIHSVEHDKRAQVPSVFCSIKLCCSVEKLRIQSKAACQR